MVLRDAFEDPYEFKPHNVPLPFIKRNYYYYDTPDGQDLVKKLWFCANTIGKAGVVYGTIVAISGYPRVETFGEGCVRVLHYTKLFLAVPSIFTITTHFLTNWREKDSELNYTIAGFLAGTYHGAWRQSVEHGIYTGLFYAAVAFCLKYNMMRGSSLSGGLVPFNFKVNTMNSLQKADFSITPEYPRNWYHADEVRERNLHLPTGTPTFLTK